MKRKKNMNGSIGLYTILSCCCWLILLTWHFMFPHIQIEQLYISPPLPSSGAPLPSSGAFLAPLPSSGASLASLPLNYKEDIASLTNFWGMVKTGDLIFFNGTSPFENLIHRATSSKWSHVAMIVRVPGRTYLWEIDRGQGYRDGPRLIPFEIKIARWKGSLWIGWRQIIMDVPPDTILKFISKVRLRYSLDSSMKGWIIGARTSPNLRFCSELMAETLESTGHFLTKKPIEYTPECWWIDKTIYDMSHQIYMPKYDTVSLFTESI